jgi:hypothetical protein
MAEREGKNKTDAESCRAVGVTFVTAEMCSDISRLEKQPSPLGRGCRTQAFSSAGARRVRGCFVARDATPCVRRHSDWAVVRERAGTSAGRLADSSKRSEVWLEPEVTPHPSRSGWRKRRCGPPSPQGRGLLTQDWAKRMWKVRRAATRVAITAQSLPGILESHCPLPTVHCLLPCSSARRVPWRPAFIN